MSCHPIKNSTARILMIEPQNSRRIMLSNAIKSMKFTQTNSVPTIKDAIAILEDGSMEVDWILTGLCREGANNGMQLLATCLANESLRHIRVSLFLEADEQFCASDAFALGLFSCHHKHSNINGMTKEIKDLIAIGETNNWNDFDIAASYLRLHLTQAKLFESLVRLEKSFLTHFPGNVTYVTNYAEALVLAGNTNAAEQMLGKLSTPHPKDRKRVQEILNNIQSAKQDSGKTQGPQSIANVVKSCVIIDSDESYINALDEALNMIGVDNIHKFASGKTALEFIKRNPEPDLIIQEWRVADYPGPALIQAVRTHGFVNTGIIVYSSLVKNTDRSLLKEIGVTDVIEKPKSPKILATIISSTIRDEHASKDISQIESKVRLFLKVKDFKAATELYGRLLKKNPPEKTKEALAAEFAYFSDNLREASDIAVQVLHSYGEDVCVLNLLGKISMKQAQFGQAIYYFNRANDLAPSNIERLCNLAVTQASAADTDAAEASLAKARSIAGDEFIIDETEVKLGLINGQVERARAFMEGFRHSSDLIAFINNRGVWLSTQGRLQDGIQLYESALKSLTGNLKEIEPIICYNIALAHVKSGDSKKALEFIRKNPAASSSELAAKIDSLNTRLTKAVKSGTQITLNSNNSPKAAPVSQLKDLSWLDPGIDPGSARLYGIFNSGAPVSPDVLKMFENMPKYGRRHGLTPAKRKSS